jgi:hypothetical protein
MSPPPAENTNTVADELMQVRRDLVRSYRPRINELDRQIVQAEELLTRLKDQRREFERQLRSLDPDALKPGRKPLGGEVRGKRALRGTEKDGQKIELVRQFLRANADSLGVFTGNSLERTMRDANAPMRISGDKMRAILPVLQDEGTIRAHAKVKGGGMAYAVIGNGVSDVAA